jgi:hypothetical protein
MKMLPEQIEAWAAVAALRDELTAAEARIEAIDRERQELVSRVRVLDGGLQGNGEISRAVRHAKITGLPTLQTAYSKRAVLRVEARWIVLDGYSASGEVFYDRTTGRRKSIRSDYDMIDTSAALAAWDEYQKRLETFGVERKSE